MTIMRRAIEGFPGQFAFSPRLEHGEGFDPSAFSCVVVAGMGGSQLPAEFLGMFAPHLSIVHWRDYGLPILSHPEKTLLIASSYSGNTEEPISAFHEAGERGIARAAIASGGELLDGAKKSGAPFVEIPENKGIQPRSALGYLFRALLAALREEALLKETALLAETLDVEAWEGRGRDLAKTLKGFVPLFYSSGSLAPLARFWKVNFNETAKIPAFAGVLPEANHNEINGMQYAAATRPLQNLFYCITLKGAGDNPRVKKRMDITRRLYEKMKIPTAEIIVEGKSTVHAAFSSVLFAEWTAYHAAQLYGSDTDTLPMVDELKLLMRR